MFESQFVIPNGMAYNSYVIIDEKIAVMDSVDRKFGEEWIRNLVDTLGEAQPDYLIVQHMEPDHSANIITFLRKYPNATVVGNARTFQIIEQFFHEPIFNKLIINEGDIYL